MSNWNAQTNFYLCSYKNLYVNVYNGFNNSKLETTQISLTGEWIKMAMLPSNKLSPSNEVVQRAETSNYLDRCEMKETRLENLYTVQFHLYKLLE